MYQSTLKLTELLKVNGSIFCTKNEKIGFEENKFNKFNERFGECSGFLHQNTH